LDAAATTNQLTNQAANKLSISVPKCVIPPHERENYYPNKSIDFGKRSSDKLRHSFYAFKRMKLNEPFAIVFLHNNSQYSIGVIPLTKTRNDIPDSFEIIIEGILKGVIHFADDKWISYDIQDQTFVELIGNCILEVGKKSDKILEITSEESFSLN